MILARSIFNVSFMAMLIVQRRNPVNQSRASTLSGMITGAAKS
jgi:hypothetical protein